LAVSSGVSAQDGPPPPTSGRVVASDLSATGGAVGPDGALYVATGGTGGDTELTPPPDAGIGEATFGLTATIVRIDPESGEQTTVAENLPSAFADGEAFGAIADIAFNGTTMYFLLTGSLNEMGATDWPNGVYHVLNSGTDTELVADISTFNDENPVAFPDAVPGGNPFALEPRGSGWIVSDGNYNRLLSITPGGDISVLSAFENIVPTGLALQTGGSVLNTWFSPAPHVPGASHVVSVAVPGGAVTELASGPASMIDVTYGPGGSAYVLQFSDFVEDESAPPEPTGRIYRLDGSELTLLVDGMILPTSLNFAGETAFVTSLTGAVYQIDDFSSIEPLPAAEPTAAATQAPAPTPTRAGVIGAPDTGSGPSSGGGNSLSLVLLLAGLGVGAVLAGARFAWKRA
jgi:hypothetical protein